MTVGVDAASNMAAERTAGLSSLADAVNASVLAS
jgi:hypothetical protein